ncbi:MAG: type II toxin-antitoxin system RelE/ParE family toxin [Planctomycetota bacterium]|nr:MAG: type II toxin-antitoxin system RelE/ParE family toxin [Planctomycetota bacterium]
MSELRYSLAARRDLRDIVAYIAEDNPRAAIAFGERIERACLRLARFPRLGTVRSSLGIGMRVFSVGSYVVYYGPVRKFCNTGIDWK